MQTGMNLYKGCMEANVADFISLMCTLNIQMCNHLLCNMWAFSITLDGATHISKLYVVVQVRFFKMGNIRKVHLITLPIEGSHW